jgi:hypothetical protein
MKTTLILLCAVLLVGGCSYITAKDTLAIDQAAGNAVSMNAKVQTDANLPACLRQWWAEDSNQWTYLSDWAHGKRATPK